MTRIRAQFLKQEYIVLNAFMFVGFSFLILKLVFFFKYTYLHINLNFYFEFFFVLVVPIIYNNLTLNINSYKHILKKIQTLG